MVGSHSITGRGSMLSAIIATHEFGAHAGADAGGAGAGRHRRPARRGGRGRCGLSDATAEVAEVAGCRFMTSAEPLGARLKAAAKSTRVALADVPARRLRARAGLDRRRRALHARRPRRLDGAARAAVFRPPGIGDLLRPGLAELIALLRVTLGGGARPEQGLLIARRFYDGLGGHPDGADAEAALLRRLGRRRIAMLPTGALSPRPRYLT